MKQFRKTHYRRIVLGILLLIGLLPQTQTVFACTFMGGNIQFVCCCENEQKQNCKQSYQTKQNASCPLEVASDYDQNATNNSDGNNSICCNVSYYELSSTLTNVTPDSNSLKVLLLDAPQPPPISISANLFIANANRSYFSSQFIPTTSPGTRTYLFTQRFRI